MHGEPSPAPDSAPIAVPPGTCKFSLPSEFRHLLLQCYARAHGRIQMFDPDFSSWGLDSSDAIHALRQFLLARRGNRLQIAYHQCHYLERECLRFPPLLIDFSHAIECRVTPRNLRMLTDSFCIADESHIVRRFHCDHFRGEAVFDSPQAQEVSAKRFADIWAESDIGLQPGRTGL
jgi:hypothetical protein